MTEGTKVTMSEPEQQSRLHRIWEYLSYVLIGVLSLRRVQVALTTILVSVLILWMPSLADFHEELLLLVAAILMIALGGYSVGDALEHGRPNPESMEDLLDTIADDLGITFETEPAEQDEELDNG